MRAHSRRVVLGTAALLAASRGDRAGTGRPLRSSRHPVSRRVSRSYPMTKRRMCRGEAAGEQRRCAGQLVHRGGDRPSVSVNAHRSVDRSRRRVLSAPLSTSATGQQRQLRLHSGRATTAPVPECRPRRARASPPKHGAFFSDSVPLNAAATISSRTATVTWKPPSNTNGLPIDRYLVQMNEHVA